MGRALYLRVRPTGKAWAFRYRSSTDEVKLSLGAYPAVSLAEARTKARIEAGKLAAGIDVRQARREEEEKRRVVEQQDVFYYITLMNENYAQPEPVKAEQSLITVESDKASMDAYFSPSWTAFQADRGRHFSVIVDDVSN